MTHDQLSGMIRQATQDVFSTMLGIELEVGDAYVDDAAPAPAEGVLALVGLAGAWAGSGTVGCSASLARHVSGQLLMQDFQHVDEEVLDAMGEVCNMILGNVKTLLEEELGPMGLSIPTVIYGRNFTTRSVAKSQWSVVPFRCAGETLEVHLCLVPSRETSVTHRHPAVLSLNNS
jgi:chemotaxis protein CheX